jgi:hypothetical protein
MSTNYAVPGLTPISDVLGHEQRITSLEHENAHLRQMLVEQAASVGRLYGLLRITTETQLSMSQRISRIELGGEVLP